jgi:type II secretory pathway predicted ATPase ExeA
VKLGVISRPQANIADFYREMGDLFGVELQPRNRWAGAKVLRQRWQAYIDATLARPVLIVDEAQEIPSAVLAELRLLSSAELDSHILLTIVLAGDGRLADRLRSDEFLPLDSRSGCAWRSNAPPRRISRTACVTPCTKPARRR